MSLFFDYDLPDRLIAQHPAARRDDSRLLVLDRTAGTLTHRHFRDLPQYLRAGDLLVLNDTKVLPARLVGRREQTGGRWEGLFLADRPDGTWELLAQTRGFVQPGEVCVTDSGLRLTLVARTDDRHWLMTPNPTGSPAELLAIHGHIPLPPYIRKGEDEPTDRDRYQTVYAAAVGSVAAPTAGLHFTPDLLAELEAQGVGVARVTLHVGLGTFAPVKADDPTQHKIHAEWAEVSADTAARVNATRAAGGRVVAVGTTTTRTLETAAYSPLPAGERSDGEAVRVRGVSPFRGPTDLFIYPPFPFRAVDALVTNFHLPRTTLLLLVQALCGSELLRRAYTEAVANDYRFFSYGDAMLVV